MQYGDRFRCECNSGYSLNSDGRHCDGMLKEVPFCLEAMMKTDGDCDMIELMHII